MKDGRIVQSGKYDNLIADKDGEFSKQMDAHNKSLSQVNPAKVQGLGTNKKIQEANGAHRDRARSHCARKGK